MPQAAIGLITRENVHFQETWITKFFINTIGFVSDVSVSTEMPLSHTGIIFSSHNH